MSRTLALVAGMVNWGLRRVGLKIVRYPIAADRRRQVLMRRSGISAVVDIGANIGQYAGNLREQGYCGMLVSYEPLTAAYKMLEQKSRCDTLWRAENCAIGDSEGTVTLNVAANSESSSLLPMLERHVEAAPDSFVTTTEVVRQTTLAIVLSQLPNETIMVKIDTQGFESQVLRGAGDSLRRVSLIEIEMSLQPLYAGQMLFRELDGVLTREGFALASMQEGFFDSVTGELLQIDAIYSRNTGTFV